MSITAYSTTYFDDFNSEDTNGNTASEKNYLRILFKPGYSVQVRELNQLQSILQSQIDRLGSSIYKDGSAIIGGNCSFDNNISVIDISTTITDLSGVTLISTESNGTGLTATLLGYKSVSSSTLRLYVRYNNSIQDVVTGANISVFPLSVNIYGDNSIGLIGTSSANKYAAGAFLDEGIFYTKGSFVWTPKQSVFLDKAAALTPVDQLIVLSVTEVVINYSTDSTLLDNATGMPNYSAPGADRYTIDLELLFVTETVELASNCIRLLTVKNSQSLDTIKKIYTSLDDVLAKRTYEESGDYTLSPFKITLRELYNDDTNGGRYKEAELPTDIPDVATAETMYSIALDPAVAYIKGYRVELTHTRDLYSTKGREDIGNIYAHSSARVGNYVIGTFANISNIPNVTNPKTTYDIHDDSVSYSQDPTVIGTCKIRAVDGTIDAIRLHLYDIVITPGKYLSDAARIYSNSMGVDFNVTSPITLIDSQYSTGLFPIPYGTTKNVKYLSYTYDTLLTAGIGSYNGVVTTFTVPRPGDEYFADTSSIVCTNAAGAVVILSGTGGGTTTVTIPGDIKTALLPITVSGPGPSTVYQKSKTITAVSQEELLGGSSTRMLDNGDVIRITLVTKDTISGPDVTAMCSISDDGQRDNAYLNSYITYTGDPSDDLYISYDYYMHGSGDYFTVNSYTLSDVAPILLYDDIPTYKGVRLSDVYDFRPLVLVGGGTVTYKPLDPDSIITSTINYYLPKIDTVIVDSNGIFSVLSGNSALEPKASIIPANSIALYTLNVPAYTFSPNDIKVNYIDNRRFTMRDIGGIEKRITNIEYYSSLSLLETSAQNASIIEDGLQRLKNGYIVDAFKGHSIGDPANPGYACATDISVGLLRPKYSMKNLRLIPDDVSQVKVHAHTITLAYTEKTLINQPYASDTLSVNPYDVAVFSGNVSLVPSSDNWKDTLHAPNLIINDTGAYDAVLLTAPTSDTFGLHWNEWQTNWVGQTTLLNAAAVNAVAAAGLNSRRVWGATSLTTNQTRTGTVTSLGYVDQTQSLGNRAIDISYIPFIRPRKIYFKGTKLKPKTRLYVFFDGINVTDYCNQLTNTPVSIDTSTDTAVYYDVTPSNSPLVLFSDPIITDEFGDIEGEFVIPNNDITRFKCGQRVFKLTDSPNNLASESTTVADIQYIASGTTETQQETILSIRKPELVVTAISQNQNVNSVTNIRYSDPLAQTFLIPNVEEGLFATGFDLFFSSKSSTLPVTAYIVLVSNGIPTQQIMPFSSVTLPSASVNVDETTGAIATRFEFSDPVYLLNGTEYAIVITSNSADYRIWVATVGGTDVISKTAITKNVYNGVLLMSQNASTWTPEQSKDMKFVMYYAEFNTADADVTFIHHLDGGVSSISVGGNAGTEEYPSSDKPPVTIAPPGVTATVSTITCGSGGFIDTITVSGGSNYKLPPLVTIKPPTGTNKRQAKAHSVISTGGTVTEIVIDDAGLGYTSDPTIFTIAPPGIIATADVIIDPVTNKISAITISNPGSGYLTAPTVTVRDFANTTDLTGAIATLESVDVSLFNLNRNAVAVNKTSITDTLAMNGVQYQGIIPNENYSAAVQFNVPTNTTEVVLTSTLKSTSSYLSPVIDVERNSLICVNNNISNPDISVTDPELTSDADLNVGRYITRTIVLNNASDRVDIYVNVNRPIAGSDIRVYVKYDEGSTWNLYNPDMQIPVSSNSNSFTEIHYTDIFSKVLFTSFAVKIVMVSSDPTQVPTIKDFRAIATF